jgi:hypothetical protein
MVVNADGSVQNTTVQLKTFTVSVELRVEVPCGSHDAEECRVEKSFFPLRPPHFALLLALVVRSCALAFLSGRSDSVVRSLNLEIFNCSAK